MLIPWLLSVVSELLIFIRTAVVMPKHQLSTFVRQMAVIGIHGVVRTNFHSTYTISANGIGQVDKLNVLKLIKVVH